MHWSWLNFRPQGITRQTIGTNQTSPIYHFRHWNISLFEEKVKNIIPICSLARALNTCSSCNRNEMVRTHHIQHAFLTLALAGGGSMRPPDFFLRCTPNYVADRAEIMRSLWGIFCATFGTKKTLTRSCQVTELWRQQEVQGQAIFTRNSGIWHIRKRYRGFLLDQN